MGKPVNEEYKVVNSLFYARVMNFVFIVINRRLYAKHRGPRSSCVMYALIVYRS